MILLILLFVATSAMAMEGEEKLDVFAWLPPEIEDQIIMPSLLQLPIAKQMITPPLQIKTEDFDALDFNPYENYLLVAENQLLVRYYPKEKYKELQSKPSCIDESIASLRYCKQEKEIVAFSTGKDVVIKRHKKEILKIPTHGNTYVPARVRFLDHSKNLAIFNKNMAYCFDMGSAAKKPMHTITNENITHEKSFIIGLTGTSEHEMIYWDSKKIIVHDLRQRTPSAVIYAPDTHAVEPDPKEQVFAIGKNKNGIALIDKRKNKVFSSIDLASKDSVTVVEYNPHNSVELIAASQGNLHIIDTHDHCIKKTYNSLGKSSVVLRCDPQHENVVVVGGYVPTISGVKKEISIIDLNYGTQKNMQVLLQDMARGYEIPLQKDGSDYIKHNPTRLVKLYTLLSKLNTGWCTDTPCSLTTEEALYVKNIMPPYVGQLLEKYGVLQKSNHSLSQSSTASLS